MRPSSPNLLPSLRPPRSRWVAAAAGGLLAVVTLLAPVRTTLAAPPPAKSTAALQPVMTCAAVAKLHIVGLTIKSATVKPPYCEVQGTIAPADTLVLRLPTRGWTQRYLQTGCGGLCGTAEISYTQAGNCQPVADGTVASATTDMGHQGQQDGSWAADDPQAQIDFAYRGVHVTAQVAKAIIAKFYGHAPSYNYFDGCSDGGREALMEAQRYPDDFDGIAAGAPASNVVVQNTFHHAWNVLANRDAKGNVILLADKLPLLHNAVLAQCDALDGVKDGVLDDPRRCDFDPSSIVCSDPTRCLTRAEADVVRKLHDGATDAHGHRLEQAISHEWGSELDWTLFVPTKPGEVTFSEQIATGFLRYLAYFNHADPNYRLTDLDFTESSFWETVQTSVYLSATDPDLRRFAAHGGKLVLWHGWSDQHISPQATLEYWSAMRDEMGGGTVDRFARLFLFPGMAHCGDGVGPNKFDVLTPVLDWVEHGRAPTKIIASLGTTRTRPVYPYPQVARYNGAGSTDDAANFHAVTPRSEPKVPTKWLGNVLYTHGYQARCKVVNGKLACDPNHV